jgi:hypothetical protein
MERIPVQDKQLSLKSGTLYNIHSDRVWNNLDDSKWLAFVPECLSRSCFVAHLYIKKEAKI